MKLLTTIKGTVESFLHRQRGSRPDARFGRRSFYCPDGIIRAGLPDPYWCDTYNKGRGKELWWMIAFELFKDDSHSANYCYRIEISGLNIAPKNWTDLDGYSAEWSQAINPALGERYGMIYQNTYEILAGGEFVVEGRISITHRNGTQFFIELVGKSESGVPFTIAKHARFTTLKIHASEHENGDSVTARLAQEMDISNLTLGEFSLGEHSYESGVRIAGATFYPRSDGAQQTGDGKPDPVSS